MARKKIESGKRNLNIAVNYVQGWGLWEAAREMIQNWIDQKEASHTPERDTIEFSCRHGYETGTIVMINHGATLTGDALSLGASGKSDDANSRGKYGEGMKLAWAVIFRLGIQRAGLSYEKIMSFYRDGSDDAIERVDAILERDVKLRVWIRNGGSRILPYIDIPEGCEVPTLHVDVRKLRGDHDENSIEMRLEGITRAEWEMIKNNCLFLNPGVRKVKTSNGYILKDSEYAGKIYVRGLYVCPTPDSARFGYSFDDLEIGRDRNLANPWEVSRLVSKMLAESSRIAAQDDAEQEDEQIDHDEIYKALQDDSGLEAKAMREAGQYDYSGNQSHFHKTMADKFKAEHGENAFPYEAGKESDAAILREVEYEPIAVNRGQLEAMRTEYNIANIRDSKRVKSVVSNWDSLTTEQRSNLDSVADMFPEMKDANIGGKFRIVRFEGVGVKADNSRGYSDISIRALDSVKETVEAVAMAFSTHKRSKESILIEMILALSGHKPEATNNTTEQAQAPAKNTDDNCEIPF